MVKLTEKLLREKCKGSSVDIVKKLNFWGHQLTDVSIVSKCSNLEVLSLSVNDISTLKYFVSLTKLRELYMRKNSISDPFEAQHLSSLTNLRFLWLLENKCANNPNYRTIVISFIPSLMKLDDKDVTDTERQNAMEWRIKYEQSKNPNQIIPQTQQNIQSSPSLPPIIQSSPQNIIPPGQQIQQPIINNHNIYPIPNIAKQTPQSHSKYQQHTSSYPQNSNNNYLNNPPNQLEIDHSQYNYNQQQHQQQSHHRSHSQPSQHVSSSSSNHHNHNDRNRERETDREREREREYESRRSRNVNNNDLRVSSDRYSLSPTRRSHQHLLPQTTKENLLLAVFSLLNELDDDSLNVVRKQLDKLLSSKK